MTISLRSNRGLAIGAVATCAVIGATSPVWATSGSSHGNDPQTTHALALVKQDAATIAALRSEVGQLRAALAHDRSELAREGRAVEAATRAARVSSRLAKHEAHAFARAKASRAALARSTPVSNPSDIAVPFDRHSFDPRTGHHCHHGDPGSGRWRH